MFRPAIVLYIRDPTSPPTGKQRLVRERPKKRRPTEVSVSYSGSPGAVGRHNNTPNRVAFDAGAVSTPHPVRVLALRNARPTHRNGENHGSSFNPADHARPAILEPSLDQLRNNAAECIRLAEAARTSAHKSFFIEMADRWLTLAERAEKM